MKIAAVEVELKALELTQLRVVAAARDRNEPDPASSILKIKGSEISRPSASCCWRRSALCAAAGTHDDGDRWNEPRSARWAGPLAPHYFNWRKVSIYGGSNEIQKISSPKPYWDCERLPMDFSFTDEQRLLKESVERLLADRYSFEARQRFMDEPTGWGRALWQSYAELGLLGLPFEDRHAASGADRSKP